MKAPGKRKNHNRQTAMRFPVTIFKAESNITLLRGQKRDFRSIEDFVCFIASGESRVAYSPGSFLRGIKKNDNFRSASFFALDFDGHSLPLDSLLLRAAEHGLSVFVVPTKSHADNCHHLRAIFDVSRSMNRAEYQSVRDYLVSIFPEADAKALNLAQLFFSPGKKVEIFRSMHTKPLDMSKVKVPQKYLREMNHLKRKLVQIRDANRQKYAVVVEDSSGRYSRLQKSITPKTLETKKIAALLPMREFQKMCKANAVISEFLQVPIKEEELSLDGDIRSPELAQLRKEEGATIQNALDSIAESRGKAIWDEDAVQTIIDDMTLFAPKKRGPKRKSHVERKLTKVLSLDAAELSRLRDSLKARRQERAVRALVEALIACEGQAHVPAIAKIARISETTIKRWLKIMRKEDFIRRLSIGRQNGKVSMYDVSKLKELMKVKIEQPSEKPAEDIKLGAPVEGAWQDWTWAAIRKCYSQNIRSDKEMARAILDWAGAFAFEKKEREQELKASIRRYLRGRGHKGAS